MCVANSRNVKDDVTERKGEHVTLLLHSPFLDDTAANCAKSTLTDTVREVDSEKQRRKEKKHTTGF